VSPRIDTLFATQDRFEEDTRHHTMQVLHDAGLYRHLLFRAPKSGSYWFEILTWPGSLTIHGDMGTYTFSRLTDMFEFFGTGPINPDYWAQKLASQSALGIKEFSETALNEVVMSHLADWSVELTEAEEGHLLAALRNALLRPELALNLHSSYEALATFIWTASGGKSYQFIDAWEYDLSAYTVHFLWCLRAITYGIRQYQANGGGNIPLKGEDQWQ